MSNYDAIHESCTYVKSYAAAAHDHNTIPYASPTDLQYRALAILPEEWHATIRTICTDEALYKSLHLHKINTLVLSHNAHVWVFKRSRHPREEFNKWNRQSLCLSLPTTTGGDNHTSFLVFSFLMYVLYTLFFD